MGDEKQRSTAASVVRRGLAVLFLAVFLFSAGMLVMRLADERENQGENAEALAIAGLTEQKSTPEQPDSSSDLPATEAENADADAAHLPEEMSYLKDIDLEALQAVNDDVAGWIIIPDTVISYPVMACADNEYYLRRTWQGTSNTGGSVFLDYRCSPEFTDFHTIVYGHRMRNNSMFGTLKYYADAGYWQEHPSVWIVTSDTIRRYDVFAAWEASISSGIYDSRFQTDADRSALLDMALSNSVISTGIVPTAEDSILTLSTCVSFGHSTRWIVQTVLALEVER